MWVPEHQPHYYRQLAKSLQNRVHYHCRCLGQDLHAVGYDLRILIISYKHPCLILRGLDFETRNALMQVMNGLWEEAVLGHPRG